VYLYKSAKLIKRWWFYNGKKSHKIKSNIANNFSSDVGKQLLIANDRNRVRWLVLVLLQDGACMDLYENRSENSLKGDPLNDTTLNPPLFSLVNTFKISGHF
jgi:hypothetical protein